MNHSTDNTIAFESEQQLAVLPPLNKQQDAPAASTAVDMQEPTTAVISIDSLESHHLHQREDPVVVEPVEEIQDETTDLGPQDEIEVSVDSALVSEPESEQESSLPEQESVEPKQESDSLFSEQHQQQEPAANLTAVSSESDTISVVAQDDNKATAVVVATTTVKAEEEPIEKKQEKQEEESLPPRSFSPAYSCDSPSPSTSPALSRVSSRQDLRRKSSFFNSKEIVISDQRYSTSAYDSMRPIADPRFKSRFQNVLSQWKARTSSN
ncbi:hypothetical protein BGZ83_005795 [Gryganskiella cystojenkinii]|nr:hypothetical protein BGZ83_005795 [Gryganskiella cystojenkinii]